MTERKRQPHQRTHLSQRKKVRIAFAFAFAFCSTPFFSMVKGIKLKEKSKRKKNETGSRPLLAGYGLGTRIQATLARILIPGLDTDPRLRIRVLVLALKHGLFGLFMDFFGLDWYLKRYARVCVCGGGNCFC
jgi:hypothetical protein